MLLMSYFNIKHPSKALIRFIFLGFFLTSSVLYSQNTLYRSNTVFIGAEHILSLDDVMNYYIINSDERNAVKAFLASDNPQHQQRRSHGRAKG